MGEAESFFAILVFLHFVEGIKVTAGNAVAFVFSRGIYRVRRPILYPGNGSWGWIPLPMLRPWIPVFVTKPGGSVDRDAVRSRIGAYNDATRRLRVSTVVLMVWMFAVGPVAAWYFELGLILIPWYAVAVVIGFVIWVQTLRAYKVEKWILLLKYVLYPLSALRARGLVASVLLEDFDPAAVAAAVGRAEDAKSLLAARLIETRFGQAAGAASLDALAAELTDGRPETLFPKPDPHPGCNSWCMRCRNQFQQDSGECPDCAGIPLTPLR